MAESEGVVFGPEQQVPARAVRPGDKLVGIYPPGRSMKDRDVHPPGMPRFPVVVEKVGRPDGPGPIGPLGWTPEETVEIEGSNWSSTVHVDQWVLIQRRLEPGSDR